MNIPLYYPYPIYETSRYFHAMCSDELDSMVPSTLAVKNGIHITYTRMNHHYYLRIPFVKIKFCSNSFIPRTATLGNRLPEVCYNTGPFKFPVKKYLFSICTLTSHFAFSYVHTTDNCVAIGPCIGEHDYKKDNS